MPPVSLILFTVPGLDFCSYTSYYVADLLARSLAGEDVSDALNYYNEQYPVTYRLWFETLYKDKYYYMGDAELMAAALLLDVGTYFIGLVIPVYKDPEREFLHLPFEGRAGRIFASMMKFYNRRLVALAKRRLATGTLRETERRVARALRRFCSGPPGRKIDPERPPSLVAS